MLVKSITEEEIYGIGHAFGYYDCGEEIGMSALPFPGKRPLQTISVLMCAGCDKTKGSSARTFVRDRTPFFAS